ncbi:hypothetical protein BGZ98_008476 [Dissophora globulifera]|nr:hypothetical protein BGZ98_008476 [Dissophora globulifera]
MGNAPSTTTTDPHDADAAVESVTFTNNYQRQQHQHQHQHQHQQHHHGDYMTHQHHSSSPSGPQDPSHPSTIPQRRTQTSQQQQQQQQQIPLPGGGPRRRASSLLSNQPYSQYTDTYNEQVLVATAAHQDKMDLHRSQQQQQQQQSMEGRASYRNSARVSRAFEAVDPLKSLDEPHNGTHRIKFIVDDEWKCSTELSAATDAEGNLVNFLEVTDEEQDELEGGHDTPVNGSPAGSYTDQIPLYALSGDSTPASLSGAEAILPLTTITPDSGFSSTAVTSNNGNSSSNSSNGRSHSPQVPVSPSSDSSSLAKLNSYNAPPISNDPPPALPPHLERVILNNVPSKEDNSVLPP